VIEHNGDVNACDHYHDVIKGLLVITLDAAKESS